MSNSHMTDPEERASSSSLGELLGEVSRDLSTLFRQELELAKAELRQSTTRASKGAGLMAGAGAASYLVLVFLSIALWWGLGFLTGLAWSAVIVAVLWGIVALVLLSMGRRELKAVRGMPSTAESLKRIPETIKEAGTKND